MLSFIKANNLLKFASLKQSVKHLSSYVQGQYQDNYEIREYFYYIDHQGQLFLDDTKIKNFTSCYKEQKFLEFFFKNLRTNDTDRYKKEFPYISYCGRERNYLKCEDLPFVVTNLDEKNDMLQLNQMHSAHWMYHFDPRNLFHNNRNGRLYYLFSNKSILLKKNQTEKVEQTNHRFKHIDNLPCEISLVKSEIGLNLMKKMQKTVENNQEFYRFEYKSKTYDLKDSDANIKDLLDKFSSYNYENKEN